jgi:dolichol-phosphate mannosyltransferase
LDRKAVEAVKNLKEKVRHLRLLSSLVGFRQTEIKFVRERRKGDKAKTPFRTRKHDALDILMSSSNRPLFFGLKVSFLMMAAGLLGMLTLGVIAILNCTGVTEIILEWHNLTTALIVFGIGFIATGNGIQSAYISYIYEEVKDRPSYIVERTVNQEVQCTEKNTSTPNR